MKETALMRKIQEKIKEEHDNRIRWLVKSACVVCGFSVARIQYRVFYHVIMHIEQELSFRQVHIGKEPVCEKYRRQLAEEREMAQQRYTVRCDPNVLSCNQHN